MPFLSPLRRPALWAALVVPLGSPEGWRPLTYSGIRANIVRHEPAGLTIEVRRSSSPLFYSLPQGRVVTGVGATGQLSGLPRLAPDATEGEGRGDDFALRIGLVLAGDKRLSWIERLLAPEWLKQLQELAPDESGFRKVDFLTVAQRMEVGVKRRHPRTKYIDETVAVRMTAPGNFQLSHKMDEPVPVIALWLHADGDDTGSEFDVQLSRLVLESEGEEPAFNAAPPRASPR